MSKEEVSAKKEIGIGQLLSEKYNHDQDDVELNIYSESYSNISYIQTTPRDISIDFLILPDVPKDGKRTINGIRVHLTHVAAQRLAMTLNDLIAKNLESGTIEPLKEMTPVSPDKK
ncbi:MAG TPA: DUF3467 domain-containing protein [Methanomassiliicoccales archaeon]|jgi:hypothetical protein|nr:DUF3467 domain-containing protein [Methanomassiliicoccales archaeon]